MPKGTYNCSWYAMIFLVATILTAKEAKTNAYSIRRSNLLNRRNRIILDASLRGKMLHALSSSRLFPKSNNNLTPKRSTYGRQNSRHPIYPLKNSILTENVGRRQRSIPSPSALSFVLNKIQKLTPASLMRRSEVRRRQRLYQELSMTSYNNCGINSESSTTKLLDANLVASVAEKKPATKSRRNTVTTTQTGSNGLSKMDIALFATYFCNIAVVTLSVVTVPDLATEHCSSPHATAAFVGGIASMAPFGGGVGKLINGFVCQRLGGQQSSWMYLVGLAALSASMSFSKSLAPIGLLLFGFEFFSSIQWTCICDVLDQHYRQKPQLMARGIALLSLSSTLGALTAKTVGVGLVRATHWRTVCRVGSLVALLGAIAMYTGVKDNRRTVSPFSFASVASSNDFDAKQHSPLAALKSILGNKLFWMIGIANSLGYLARSSDRLLGPFLQDAASLPGAMAAGLTSSVTIGMVFGLIQGRIFSKIDSVKLKMKMVKYNYSVSLVSVLGLAISGLASSTRLVNNSAIVAASIALFSGIMASTVSFQFYQFPNLVSANVFPDNAAISLSLMDATGYFVTAQVLAANSHVLEKFSWCASWTFLAMVFGVFGTVMIKAIQPVLLQARKNQREHSRIAGIAQNQQKEMKEIQLRRC